MREKAAGKAAVAGYLYPSEVNTSYQGTSAVVRHRAVSGNFFEVLGLNRSRIILLVVPPHTDPDRAHATMMAAAGPNNVSTVGGLFMAGEPDRETGTQTAAAQERWDSEGGAE